MKHLRVDRLSRWIFVALLGWVSAAAAPRDFNVPAGPATSSLLRFSQQAQVELLFSFDALQGVNTPAVQGRFEPAEALQRLLAGSGYEAVLTPAGKFAVSRAAAAPGKIVGQVVDEADAPLVGVRVALEGGDRRRSVFTDLHGAFTIDRLPPGVYRLVLSARGYRTMEVTDIALEAGQGFALAPQVMVDAEGVTHLERVVVEAKAADFGAFVTRSAPYSPRQAAGNLDVERTENDVLPYVIYERDEIIRSGVVNLNDFLQRELLEADASSSPPENSSTADPFISGSTNLTLRGFGSEETVILLNGRRLPEVLTTGTGNLPPDVNFIPLSLVQQVQVLPVSAGALYTGNAVGGVINIVLRPEQLAESNEVTATYNNALGGFDAPQSSISLLHGRSLLDGRLRFRLSASFTETLPPTEAELGYRQARLAQENIPLGDRVFRATPNVRSADGSPLFGPGSASVTSVAPGADGSGGLTAFAGREGVRNLDLFESPGGMAVSSDSIDLPYGRAQDRVVYFLSTLLDATPWLQLGLDAAYSHTTINRGYDVLTTDLLLNADSPANPFGQAVRVSLNETAPLLGQGYSEAQLDFYSVVGSAVLTLPWGWQATADLQLARSAARYRGLAGVDQARWLAAVESGEYPIFRDTQIFGPPAVFYDRVLIYEGERGAFVSVGDYDTLDATFRLTHDDLPLPTGSAQVHAGVDFRRNELAGQTRERRYSDGTLAREPEAWSGRAIERVSVFGEVLAPLLPANRLPGWLRSADIDTAARYTIADTSAESNFAPTFGLKLDFVGGLAFRGSVTTSNRFPAPNLSQRVATGSGGGSGISGVTITDPKRGGQQYSVTSTQEVNPDLVPEAAVSQSAGLIYQRGERHRFRAALDFVDTQKTNEIVSLQENEVLNLEDLLPGRVERAPLAPSDPNEAGLITSILTGQINLASRHSQNWTVSLDYAGPGWAGGTLELRSRVLWFQRYERQVLPTSPLVDELGDPSGSSGGLLRYRASVGANWSNDRLGFGFDGYYFHARELPFTERIAQGSAQIDAYWQWDVYAQAELTRWLRSNPHDLRVRMLLRINNVFDAAFPAYASQPSGAGVQPYGDWRGPTYSLSVTTEF